MTTHKTLVLGSLFAVWCGLTALNPQNPPAAKTGAPGEGTCADAGCHSGGNFTGTVTISGVPDTVVANQSYTITLTHASNAVRAGFQLTALNAQNQKAGTLTAGAGSNLTNAMSRQYVRHSNFKTLSGGSTSWTFTWTAPATTPAGPITFYFASLAANGNGSNSGDNPLLGTRQVAFSATSAAHDLAQAINFSLYPNPAAETLHVGLPGGARGTVQLFDANGRLHVEQAIDGTAALDVRALPAGTYSAIVASQGATATRQWVKL
jgi:hypothetical protein